MMTEFIRDATEHASKCGTPIDLNVVDKKYGAGIIQKWQCPKCDEVLELRNCNQVRTTVVEEGRRELRKQPELNLKIAIGTRTNGINMEKVHGFIDESGRQSNNSRQKEVMSELKN